MPLEIDDEFEQEKESERQKAAKEHERNAAIEEVRVSLQEALPKENGRTLLVELAEKQSCIYETEYHIYFYYEAKWGPFKQRRTKVIAQVFDFRKNECAACSFGLVVFSQADIELAKKVSSILTMVYLAENIKLYVSRLPRNPQAFMKER
jgi:hypothetical protein